jgi:hypothetical protein
MRGEPPHADPARVINVGYMSLDVPAYLQFVRSRRWVEHVNEASACVPLMWQREIGRGSRALLEAADVRSGEALPKT